MKQFLSELPAALPAILIAILGGFARFMLDKNFDWKTFLADLVIAGFAGLLTYNLCSYYQFNSDLSSFLVGMSGFLGVNALEMFARLFRRWLGVKNES